MVLKAVVNHCGPALVGVADYFVYFESTGGLVKLDIWTERSKTLFELHDCFTSAALETWKI